MKWLMNKSIRRRMLIVALINGFLIFGSVFLLSKAIERQNYDALLVNLAGRQRMLSQRISKSSIALSSQLLSVSEKDKMLTILEESKQLYDDTLNMFINGGTTELGSITVSTPAITVHRDTLEELNTKWLKFREAIDTILEVKLNSSYSNDPMSQEIKIATVYIINENESLLWKTDEIVSILQEEAESHVSFVKSIMFLIVLLEIIVIFFFIRSIDIVILNPFNRMFGAIEVIGRGELFVKDQQEHYIEWIQAFQHISEMNDNLYKATAELNNLNQGLEEQVRTRTADLEDTIHKLEKTYKKLLETEKQASLGALVAGVAHEVNTPLGVCLTGSSQLSDESAKLHQKILENQLTKNDLLDYLNLNSELTSILIFNINRAANIIRSFKKIAIHQSTEIIESFYLDDYINDLWVSLSHIAKQYNVNFENKIAHHLIYGDPGDYSQIFTNLIANTFLHGYDVGEDVYILISSTIEDDLLRIDYKDFGKGIKSDSLVKIFDPFYTTNREGGGSGLGLNVIYQIITNKLSGEIQCNSEQMKFTEFVIRIGKYTEDDYE